MKKNMFATSAEETGGPSLAPVAIIGFSVLLPDATDEDSLLRLFSSQLDRMRPFPSTRAADVQQFADYFERASAVSAKFFQGAWLDRVDLFDRHRIEMTKAEADLCDPHQRLFLQSAIGAIENAGYGGDSLRGSRTAVIACGDTKKGVSYYQLVTEQAFDLLPLSLPGNIASFTPGRLSYLLDLNGPSQVVDTGCCSSLVGVHEACRGLGNNAYDYAVVACTELNFLPLDTGLRVGIESGDGHNRTFAHHEGGTGFGEGSIAVVLKRLDDAVADHDPIHGVVLGTSVNHGGRGVGPTTPSPAAQSEVIVDAWQAAGVEPEEIGYVEAHGTATAIGDPIEWQGLDLAFGGRRARRQSCAVGSVKSQIGHLMNGAGLAGFLRSVLSVKHARLFPSLHFLAPNPNIDFVDSALYLVDRPTPWVKPGRRVAGVSSFGMSGTNCHVVVEEWAGHRAPVSETDEPVLLPISAQSSAHLRAYCSALTSWLGENLSADISAVAGTLAFGRSHQNERVAIFARSPSEAMTKLDALCGAGAGASSCVVDDHGVSESNRRALKGYLRDGLLPRELPGVSELRRVHLPAPPFDAERCWIDRAAPTLFSRFGGTGENESVNGSSAPGGEIALFDLVYQTYARKLGVSDFDPATDLVDLEASSLSVIQIVAELSRHVDLILAEAYEHPSVSALTEFLAPRWEQSRGAASQSKLDSFVTHVRRVDAALVDDGLIRAAQEHYAAQTASALKAQPRERAEFARERTVMLTGATGLIGNHLLAHVLRSTQWKIETIVRGESHEHARGRLAEAFDFYQAEHLGDYGERVSVSAGDCSEAKLGLAKGEWSRLTAEVDEVVHLAALVRHSGSDEAFEQANVEAVRQVVDFCQDGRQKTLHFSSSMAVGVAAEPDEHDSSVRLFTEFDRVSADHCDNPYSKSKAIGEALVAAARAEGVETGMYRLGNAVFRSDDGTFQRNPGDNAIYTLLRSFVELGCWPDSDRPELDLGSVDLLVDAFVRLMATDQSNDEAAYHLYNQKLVSINSLGQALVEAGYRVERLSLEDFLDRVAAQRHDPQHTATADRLLFHLGYLGFDAAADAGLANIWRPINELTNTVLLDAGFEWHEPTAADLDLMVGAPRTRAFLDQAQSQR